MLDLSGLDTCPLPQCLRPATTSPSALAGPPMLPLPVGFLHDSWRGPSFPKAFDAVDLHGHHSHYAVEN
jgi:hypothetical protein